MHYSKDSFIARCAKVAKRHAPVIALLILFIICPNAHALTLTTMLSDCRNLIRDGGTSRQRFSDSQLTRFLNEGQKDATQQIYPIQKSFEFALVSGTTYYSMPSDFLHPLRVTYQYRVIGEKSPRALDSMREWQTVSGTEPQNYYIAFASRTKMGFYPFPQGASSTGTIRMDYVSQATDLSAAGDEPFNGIDELQPYGYLISFYCAYRGALIDGSVDLAQAYIAEYQRGLKRMSEDATSRPAYNPSFGAGK